MNKLSGILLACRIYGVDKHTTDQFRTISILDWVKASNNRNYHSGFHHNLAKKVEAADVALVKIEMMALCKKQNKHLSV